MAELVAILEAMREAEYSEQKFAAAMQGVDLDKETGRKTKEKVTKRKHLPLKICKPVLPLVEWHRMLMTFYLCKVSMVQEKGL